MKFPSTLIIKVAGLEIRLWRTLISLICIGVFLALGHYAFSAWVTHRFTLFKNTLTDAGYHTSLAEIAPANVTHEDNAALHYTSAFHLFTYNGAIDAIPDDRPFPALDPEDRSIIARCIEMNKKAMELIRSGRTRTTCRYERNYAAGINVEHRETAPSLQLSQLLNWRAQIEADAGRITEARECIQDIYALGEAFKNEPLAISHLVRMSIVATGTHSISKCVGHAASQEELLQWLEILPSPQSLDGSTERAMRGELASLVQLAENPVLYIFQEGRTKFSVARMGFPLVRPIITYKSIASLEKAWKLTDCCRRPYPESRMSTEIIRPPTLDCESDSSDLIEMLIPAVRRILDRQAITQSLLAVNRAGIEHELHRLKNGEYPEKTSVTDPCTGKPLLYEPAQRRIRSQGPPNATENDIQQEGLIWKLRHP